MPANLDPKKSLDAIIGKSRVHLYKPIQIAEILYHHRQEKGWDLSDRESYRNVSKKWRDNISLRLVGRRSTSSQKYQDNIFEANAMPPILFAALGEINNKGGGFVEAYIYKSLQAKLRALERIEKYVKNATPDTFSLKQLFSFFTANKGLKRSIDKVYEISVYALFSTIVRALKAKITLELENKDKEILNDFKSFMQAVLGIDAKKTSISAPASLYRVGVTNAADRGLDMWANFGVAVQVKHLTLTPITAGEIVGNIMADRIVIVCLDVEKEAIETILKQVGLGGRIQGIITLDDLDRWYELCLSKKYRDQLGKNLLLDLRKEFRTEFPSSVELEPFLRERKYDEVPLPEGWR